METWKPVVGWESSHSVSDAGRVRRDVGGAGTCAGKILKATSETSGYQTLTLCVKRRCSKVSVHRLVTIAFLGSPDTTEHQVNHKNGIKGDNRADNLEWATSAENNRHAVTMGLTKTGIHAPYSKMTLATLAQARHLREQGQSLTSIGKTLGIDRTNIRRHLKSASNLTALAALPPNAPAVPPTAPTDAELQEAADGQFVSPPPSGVIRQVADRDEAIRLLAERNHSNEHMLACYRTGKRPSEIALDRARETVDAVLANPLAAAALLKARVTK